jgi:hypothetical protein
MLTLITMVLEEYRKKSKNISIEQWINNNLNQNNIKNMRQKC